MDIFDNTISNQLNPKCQQWGDATWHFHYFASRLSISPRASHSASSLGDLRPPQPPGTVLCTARCVLAFLQVAEGFFSFSAAHNGRQPPSLGVTLPRCFPAHNILYRPGCSLQIPARLPNGSLFGRPLPAPGVGLSLDLKFSLLLQSLIFSLSQKYDNHN